MAVWKRVNSVFAQRLWNVLRITLLMIRKGLISKRRMITDINLMIKRGKLLRKSLSNLIPGHRHNHHHMGGGAAFRGGLQEYEFSCRDSPNPVFYRFPKRKHHFYHFPCINFHEEDETEESKNRGSVLAMNPKTPDYSFNFRSEFAPGEKNSPLLSPLEVRVSNYSSLEEDENEGISNGQVDREAEEFIRKFYEQLRVQSRIHLLN